MGEIIMRYKLKIPTWQELAEVFPGLERIGAMEQSGELNHRSYQVLACLSTYLHGCRGIVKAATGSGKTLISAALCGMLSSKNILVLVGGTALVDQTYKSFQKFLGEDIVGVLRSKEHDVKRVTVSSIHYLSYYLQNKLPANVKDEDKFNEIKKYLAEVVSSAEAVILDETHHGSSDSWSNIVGKIKAPYRVGFSGTPLKHEDLADTKLIGLIGPVIFDLSAAWLQERGYVSQANLLIKRFMLNKQELIVPSDGKNPAHPAVSYAEVRKCGIIENARRNKVIAQDIFESLKNSDNRILVLTGNSVDLAFNIGKELEALVGNTRKPKFLVITGKSTKSKTTSAFNRLRDGRIKCVITTKLADEGLDVPDVNVLLIVGGGKAHVATVQRVGRGLRPREGKVLQVIDYFTDGNRYLQKHDKARKAIYTSEAFFSEVQEETL